MFLLAEFLEAHEYPEHIKQLVQKERELEEQEKRQREIERNTCKVRISAGLSNKTLLVRNVSTVNHVFLLQYKDSIVIDVSTNNSFK